MRYYIIALTAAGLLLTGITNRTAHAQLSVPDLRRNLPDVQRELPREPRLRRDVDDVVEEVSDTAREIVPLAEQLAVHANDVVETAMRAFVPGVSPDGETIELDTVVVLVDTERVAGLADVDVILVARRDLTSLGLTLLTLKKPTERTLPALVDELRTRWPAAVVDLNHLYTSSATGTGDAAAATSGVDEAPDTPAADLRVGIIDSAVQTDHVMLRQSRIVAADFAMHEGMRPLTHGTAVASLVATSAGDRAAIYSAGVFFQVSDHAPGATTEGLVAAIDWLVAEDVPVINMSLAGPANDLLELVIRRVAEQGHIVVAAVGNNGPSGEPMYPAAYDVVVGVTAVDRENRVFRYANRGDHVDFAARGVDVRVADSTSGGLRIESGTSMASPHVAVVIADLLYSGEADVSAARSWLIAAAEDLGRKGFDPVYGHGLITQPPVVASGN